MRLVAKTLGNKSSRGFGKGVNTWSRICFLCLLFLQNSILRSLFSVYLALGTILCLAFSKPSTWLRVCCIEDLLGFHTILYSQPCLNGGRKSAVVVPRKCSSYELIFFCQSGLTMMPKYMYFFSNFFVFALFSK